MNKIDMCNVNVNVPPPITASVPDVAKVHNDVEVEQAQSSPRVRANEVKVDDSLVSDAKESSHKTPVQKGAGVHASSGRSMPVQERASAAVNKTNDDVLVVDDDMSDSLDTDSGEKQAQVSATAKG